MSDNSQLIDELLATIALIEVTPDVFEGKSHDYVGSRIFGGQVLAQAIMAAAHLIDHWLIDIAATQKVPMQRVTRLVLI